MAERPSTAASDNELLDGIAAGHAEALSELFRRHYALVHRFALHMTGSPASADDVTQEVFLAVMRDAGRYEPGRSTATAWLCGIARNLARRRLQQDRAAVALAEPSAESAPGFCATPDPIGELITAERIDDLRRAVLSLPLTYREVVVLCDLQQLSYAEAADAIGCAIGTVRSRLHRARGLLVMKLRSPAAKKEPVAKRLRYLA